jgi:stage IV sporulation protein FB
MHMMEAESEDLENMEEQENEDHFPAKPSEKTEQKSLPRSFISMLLFIAGFHLVFKWELADILVLAVVILIHELGHYLAMRYFKYQDLSIFFIPLLGAVTTGSKDDVSQKQNIVILLAGPIPGIFIGILLFYVGSFNSDPFISKAANTFIFLNLFNLLPVIPLDGGKVLQALFFETNEIISTIFIIISIAALGSYSIITESYFLLIIPVFLVLQLTAGASIRKLKKAIQDKGININQSFNELTNREYWMIREEIGTHLKYYRQFITPGNHSLSPNEDKIIKQVKSIIQKKPTKDLTIGGKILITSLWALSFIIPIACIVLISLHIR